jgi:hypothetical protein
LLLAQVSRAVKHCVGLWGTFHSGNRYGVSAKRPKNSPPDNSTESTKRKAISLVTVDILIKVPCFLEFVFYSIRYNVIITLL